MGIPERYVFMFGAAICLVAVVTSAMYFMDLDLLNNNILETYIFQPLKTAQEISLTTPVKLLESNSTPGNQLKTTMRQEKNDNPYEITIVTMFLNIGRFQKGGGGHFTPDTYKNWMRSWGWLTNRVIAYFDNDEDLNIFRQIRSSQPENMTVIIRINRTDLPAFNNLETIRRIFGSPGYPKHHPNTVVPEYSCAMSAKHDALLMAIKRDLVHTNYLTWMDIGLFRNFLNPGGGPKDGRFTLEVPENFNSSCVSFSEVTPRQHVSKYSPWEYISNNMVWVAGGFVLGTKETVRAFSESYKQMVTRLLEKNMASTDQQVIGAMYSPDYVKNQTVCVKPYPCSNGQFGLGGSDLVYFCLPYICKDSADKRQQNIMTSKTTS